MTLEDIWKEREERIYPGLFGPMERGVFPLEAGMFKEQFRQEEIDPRWLNLCVLEYSPIPSRPSWLYVTSGYSNPWHQEPQEYDPAGESGSGIEFFLATTEQGDWPIRALQSMLAFDVLLAAGRVLNGQPLSLFDRIPLGGPVNHEPDCLLRNLILAPAEHVPGEFHLPSGLVRLAGFTAVTDAELAFAKANSSQALLDRLRAAGHHPVNDPKRASIL